MRRIRRTVQGFQLVFRSPQWSFREALECAAVIEGSNQRELFGFELAQRTLKCACR